MVFCSLGEPTLLPKAQAQRPHYYSKFQISKKTYMEILIKTDTTYFQAIKLFQIQRKYLQH